MPNSAAAGTEIVTVGMLSKTDWIFAPADSSAWSCPGVGAVEYWTFTDTRSFDWTFKSGAIPPFCAASGNAAINQRMFLVIFIVCSVRRMRLDSYFSPYSATVSTSPAGLESPQMTLSPHTTLNPATVESPHTTLSPQTTLEGRITCVPHTALIIRLASPQTTLDPVTTLTFLVELMYWTAGESAVLLEEIRSTLFSAAQTSR